MKNNKLTYITNPLIIDRELWHEFVAGHPAGNIFQTPDFYHVAAEAPRHKAVVVCCMEGESISGILVAAVVSTLPSPLFGLTARSVVPGGPLVKDNNPEIADALLKEYERKLKKGALFSQFRNLTSMNEMHEAFIRNGYSFEGHLDIHIDLGKGRDVLWQEMKSSRRNKINQAYRLGVEVKQADCADNTIMSLCFGFLSSVYSREGLPLPPPSYFEQAAAGLKQSGGLKIFTAVFDGEVIGCRLILAFGKTLYDWYAASSDKHLDKFPNDILPWEIFCYGIDRGYRFFDFGGAGKPGVPYGVRDFKKSFGGTLVNYGRYNKVHRPILNMLIMKAFRLRQAVIRKR